MLLLSFTQFRRLILACLILPLAMHSTGFAQRSSLPFALRVLYDSFEARMEMVEGEWWLEMPDLIEGTDLPIFAYMDDDDDLTIGVTLGEPYVDVDAAYGQRNSLERWTVIRADDGDLLCFDWIQKYSEEDIVVEFVLSVLELSAFIEGWKVSNPCLQRRVRPHLSVSQSVTSEKTKNGRPHCCNLPFGTPNGTVLEPLIR